MKYHFRLSLACAQCSAEAGALRVALTAADRAVEAYDVLLALAETAYVVIILLLTNTFLICFLLIFYFILGKRK